ncbi:triadin-like [Bos indicus x Bos taurus]|uniref:triadin-like n=1 Tax=Bos indicus x Bos taurus TaxID=30522 RepID=UPI000F7D576E|nr:triadin-like [Bos indicus x Bos taurus]
MVEYIRATHKEKIQKKEKPETKTVAKAYSRAVLEQEELERVLSVVQGAGWGGPSTGRILVHFLSAISARNDCHHPIQMSQLCPLQLCVLLSCGGLCPGVELHHRTSVAGGVFGSGWGTKEKKAKTREKIEEKIKKEVKGVKQEKVKQTATKVKEVQKTSPKPKKDEKDAAAVSKHEQKDQYAFCRYMIDIFVHGDLKPGQSPAIPPPLPTEQASRPTLASPTLEEKEEEKKKAEKNVTSETKKKDKEDVKMKTEKETAMDVKRKEPSKAPETKQGTIKVAAQAPTKKEEKKEGCPDMESFILCCQRETAPDGLKWARKTLFKTAAKGSSVFTVGEIELSTLTLNSYLG